MRYWCRKRGGHVSVLAQREVSEDPPRGNDASRRVGRWAGEMLRAIETYPPCFPL